MRRQYALGVLRVVEVAGSDQLLWQNLQRRVCYMQQTSGGGWVGEVMTHVDAVERLDPGPDARV